MDIIGKEFGILFCEIIELNNRYLNEKEGIKKFVFVEKGM